MRSSFLLLVMLVLACAKKEPPQASNTAPSSSALAAETPHPSAGHPPTAAPANPHAPGADPHAGIGTPQGGAAAEAAPTEPPRAGGLTWEAPAPLQRQAPKSSMRVAQYGVAGGPQAELAVFYFGADQGGTVEANMTRWVGQFKQPDGKPTEPKRSERKVHGVDVALVEASGTYGGGMAMPGGPAPGEQANALMLGAIAKGPEGSVFFKLVGPKAEVESARAAFDGLVASIRKADAAAPASP